MDALTSMPTTRLSAASRTASTGQEEFRSIHEVTFGDTSLDGGAYEVGQ